MKSFSLKNLNEVLIRMKARGSALSLIRGLVYYFCFFLFFFFHYQIWSWACRLCRRRGCRIAVVSLTVSSLLSLHQSHWLDCETMGWIAKIKRNKREREIPCLGKSATPMCGRERGEMQSWKKCRREKEAKKNWKRESWLRIFLGLISIRFLSVYFFWYHDQPVVGCQLSRTDRQLDWWILQMETRDPTNGSLEPATHTHISPPPHHRSVYDRQKDEFILSRSGAHPLSAFLSPRLASRALRLPSFKPSTSLPTESSNGDWGQKNQKDYRCVKVSPTRTCSSSRVFQQMEYPRSYISARQFFSLIGKKNQSQ